MTLHNQEVECFGNWVVLCSWNNFLCLFFLVIFCFFNQLPKIPQTTVVLYVHEL